MKAILALSLIALAFAGCTGEGETAFETPPQNSAGEYVVKMTQSNRFIPANFQVPVGAVVSFVHEGGAHNVVSEDNLWTGGQVGADFKLTTTTEMVGDNGYYCAPHKNLGMAGIMRVLA